MSEFPALQSDLAVMRAGRGGRLSSFENRFSATVAGTFPVLKAISLLP